MSRAEELHDAFESIVIPYIEAADRSKLPNSPEVAGDRPPPRPVLVDSKTPKELEKILGLHFADAGVGRDGLVKDMEQILQYSVNTWDQGFMDKLYSSTNPVGVVAEALTAVLNTNCHVYQVSPVLTLVEHATTQLLARLIGWGPHAGGFSQPGGSASNQSSIVVARNTLYPETKAKGNGDYKFRLFTSAHGHYSVEKAAQMFGMGSDAVIDVPVDDGGRMEPADLVRLVQDAVRRGETPLYVNATAGSTVFGSYDPFVEIAAICKRHNMWLHIDGSFGGNAIFSENIRNRKMDGIQLSDSFAITPHKMLNVPMTSSFLILKNLRHAHKAFTLPAGYLFHNDLDDNPDAPLEIFDIADLTPQCGRRGDALKLFLSLQYYGLDHYKQGVERAFRNADKLFGLIQASSKFRMLSRRPLPCLQVCFYYHPDRIDVDPELMDRRTAEMASRLIRRGWMIDYAPGEAGKFFRVVVNMNVRDETLELLVKALEDVGAEVVAEEPKCGHPQVSFGACGKGCCA